MQQAGLSLTFPKNSVTWSARELESTVDLIFILDSLLGAITECTVRYDLHHRLDHYPIVTYLDLAPNLEPEIKQRAWKSADPEKVLETAKKLTFDLPHSLTTESEIDTYLTQITRVMHQIIDQTVPWRKPSPKAQSFWTLECGKLTKMAKKLRRQYENSRSTETWKEYQNMQIKKAKAIQKAKTFYFKESIHKAGISSKGI